MTMIMINEKEKKRLKIKVYHFLIALCESIKLESVILTKLSPCAVRLKRDKRLGCGATPVECKTDLAVVSRSGNSCLYVVTEICLILFCF